MFTSDNLGLPRMPDLLHAKSDVTLKTNLSGQESDSVSESRVAWSIFDFTRSLSQN